MKDDNYYFKIFSNLIGAEPPTAEEIAEGKRINAKLNEYEKNSESIFVQ